LTRRDQFRSDARYVAGILPVYSRRFERLHLWRRLLCQQGRLVAPGSSRGSTISPLFGRCVRCRDLSESDDLRGALRHLRRPTSRGSLGRFSQAPDGRLAARPHPADDFSLASAVSRTPRPFLRAVAAFAQRNIVQIHWSHCCFGPGPCGDPRCSPVDQLELGRRQQPREAPGTNLPDKLRGRPC